MITKEEFEKYTEESNVADKNEKAVCWHCKEHFKEKIVYGIIALNTEEQDDSLQKYLLFHKKCFESVAGADYVFEE